MLDLLCMETLTGSDEWWKGRWKSEGKDGTHRKDGLSGGSGSGGGFVSPAEKSSTAGGGSPVRTLTIEAWSSQSRVAVTVDGATVGLAFSFFTLVSSKIITVFSLHVHEFFQKPNYIHALRSKNQLSTGLFPLFPLHFRDFVDTLRSLSLSPQFIYNKSTYYATLYAHSMSFSKDKVSVCSFSCYLT